jgi:hypothetical protein
MPLHSSKQWRVLTVGVNKVVNIPPRGQSPPLEAKFTPRGEVKNGPLVQFFLGFPFTWAFAVTIGATLDKNPHAEFARNAVTKF